MDEFLYWLYDYGWFCIVVCIIIAVVYSVQRSNLARRNDELKAQRDWERNQMQMQQMQMRQMQQMQQNQTGAGASNVPGNVTYVCTNCGNSFNGGENAPNFCPKCGKPLQ
jgi:rubrerythrin